MFRLEGNMKFVNINQGYLQALNTACSEVYYKNAGYDNKPYVGILINKEDRRYVIPLSSAKEKHKRWKNVNKECYLVYEYADKNKMRNMDIWTQGTDRNTVKHILSVLDVKKMIPIKEGVYSVVNINKDTADTKDAEKYKDLLNKEYIFCLKIIEDVIKKANNLYDRQILSGKVVKFCCDFKALEKVCDTYIVNS